MFNRIIFKISHNKLKITIFLFCACFLFFGLIGTASAADYYIDPSQGSNGDGSIGSPYNSFTEINALTGDLGGSTIYIKADTSIRSMISLNQTTNFTITKYGSGANPIIKPTAVISSGWEAEDDYWYVASTEGRRLIWTPTGGSETALTSVTAKASIANGNFWFDSVNSRIYFKLPLGANPSAGVLEQNTSATPNAILFSECGGYTISYLDLRYGRSANFSSMTTGNNPIITYNSAIYAGFQDAGNTNNTGFNVYGATFTESVGLLFSYNTSSYNDGHGIEIGKWVSGTVSYNTLDHNNTRPFEAWVAVSGVVFSNNTADGNQWGVLVYGDLGLPSTNFSIYYNKITNCKTTCLDIQSGTGNKVYNNVFSASSTAIHVVNFNYTDYNTETDFSNNIIVASGANTYAFRESSSSTITGDENIWVLTDGAGNVSFPKMAFDSSEMSPDTLAQFKTRKSPQMQSDMNVDPQFVGGLIGLNDFHLLSTSPAINVGVDTDLTADYDSVSVPRGTGYEIGAHEYPVPIAPTIGAPQAPSSSSIRWNFTDASNDETGFRIYDNTGAVATSSAVAGLSYLDETGLSVNTQYTGRYATAYNSYGDSASSSIAASIYTLVGSPTGFTGTAGLSTADLSVDSFTNATAGSSGYYFSRSGANSGWLTTNSWTDSSLTCGTSYAYSAVYRNGDAVETSAASLTKSTHTCSSGMPIGWSNPPAAPAGGFVVSINGDVESTATSTVILNLKSGIDVTRMAVSNFADFRNANQEPYVSSKVWNLCWENAVLRAQSECQSGVHTVYVKFYTTHGVASEIVSDSIIYKTDREVVENVIGVLTTSTGHNAAEVIANVAIKRFVRSLKFGHASDDVKQLQVFLNQDPDTCLAKSGPGSSGKETKFFGRFTKISVIKFQEKYADEILAPLGLKKGTGFVGKSTIAKLNQLIGGE